MPPKRKGGFFAASERPEDEAARQREVEALIATRRTFPQEIGLERIGPNPFQARREFSNLEELAESIRQQGFTSRLRVRPDPKRPGFFQLVYGERRLRAARLAELAEVPCDVAEHTDEELIEIGLAENIQRRDLDPLEEAQAFQTFIDERGYSIRRLAERIGKDKSYIEDRVALLKAPEDVQQMIVERPDALRAAREIAKLPDARERQGVIAGVVEGRLNTQDVRGIVREATGGQPAERPRMSPEAGAHLIERDAATIRTIIVRWRRMAEQDTQTRDTISDNTVRVLHALNELVQALEA